MAEIKINIDKDSRINKIDQINQKTYSLDEPNQIKEGLILLYIYYLKDLPLHGYKVGMTKCKLGETFWHAIKDRITNQEKELVLDEEDYKKYGKDRVVQYWGICLKDFDVDFKDHIVHRKIMEEWPESEKENEWFSGSNLSINKIIKVFEDYRNSNDEPYEIYTPRKEQREAIDAMSEYFSNNPYNKRYLLNCKMRFGKCFTVYKYAEETNKKKVLILTFVPAVQDEWHNNLRHIKTRFEYITDDELKQNDFQLDNYPQKPYVVFLSLQNYLGKDSESKTTKEKIQKLQGIDFDLLILDEYHFGAWNERTQETFEDIEKEYQKNIQKEKGDIDIIKKFNISVDQTICLSGTPFKALDRGDFTDENTFSYSYFDEQKNKYPKAEEGNYTEINPDYAQFPDMKIYGYNMANLLDSNVPFLADLMREEKSINEDHKLFLLNKFFETEKDKDSKKECRFIYEEEIIKWLGTLRGCKYEEGFRFPFDYDVIEDIKDSLWLMPTVNSCIAMTNLLQKNDYFRKFEIINLSDPSVGAGTKALKRLKDGIKESENTNKLGTISLTVNKLTLGVTVEQWRAVFVLKDLASPEQYFQSIFRIQTPYVIDRNIKKMVCNVYDFNIDRATSLLLKYADETNRQSTTKLEIADLIVKYMPIYLKGDVNKPIDRDVFYNMAMFGDTSGQALSKKITNTSRTTHADGQTITDMLNDDECVEVINKVFSHTKFAPTKKQTRPIGEPDPIHKKSEYKRGLDIGYKEGEKRCFDFADLDNCQVDVDKAYENLYLDSVACEYDEEQKKWFHDGIEDGFMKGINAPIKKMQCGAEDGIKFAAVIKESLGEDIKYNSDTRTSINNIVNHYLNDINNIPKQYHGMLYLKWYKNSFKAAVKTTLTDHQDSRTIKYTEDVDNVLKHILARLFQFLYISVYRETTFDEIFKNADPYVFLSAVGITKEDFQKLNKYHIFQEKVLDLYIHEFFVNETLGKTMTKEELENDNYRNSFNWFGFGVEN